MGAEVHLIQEDYVDEPWRMLVACVLLNKTRGEQVKLVLPVLFERYPTAAAMAKADLGQLALMISGLGLENRRAWTLKAMSIEWCNRLKQDLVIPYGLPGIGQYAIDSWKIFIEGRLDVEPTDLKLKEYLVYRKTSM